MRLHRLWVPVRTHYSNAGRHMVPGPTGTGINVYFETVEEYLAGLPERTSEARRRYWGSVSARRISSNQIIR